VRLDAPPTWFRLLARFWSGSLKTTFLRRSQARTTSRRKEGANRGNERIMRSESRDQGSLTSLGTASRRRAAWHPAPLCHGDTTCNAALALITAVDRSASPPTQPTLALGLQRVGTHAVALTRRGYGTTIADPAGEDDRPVRSIEQTKG
jgi:hypothetical protein